MNLSVKQKYSTNSPQHFLYALGGLPGFLIIGLITVYQWTLSPDHGLLSFYSMGVCKFRPTCSEATKEAIYEHGILRGLAIGFQQIKKCH